MKANLVEKKEQNQKNDLSSTVENNGGKYLTFLLGNEVYGVQIIKVQEIIKMQNVSRIPRVKDFVRGVINLRGKIIPVVDLRVRFGMNRQNDTDNTCIVVVQVANHNEKFIVGLIIDEVREVLSIAGENIEPSIYLGGNDNDDFFLGIGKVYQEVKILLDIDQIINTTDLSQPAHIEL